MAINFLQFIKMVQPGINPEHKLLKISKQAKLTIKKNYSAKKVSKLIELRLKNIIYKK
jgi:hypothetical protein